MKRETKRNARFSVDVAFVPSLSWHCSSFHKQKVRKRRSFRTRQQGVAIDHDLKIGIAVLRENGTFFEFSLCLSRACLGKIMHFIYKWLKKCRFLTIMLVPATAPVAMGAPATHQELNTVAIVLYPFPARKRHSFLSAFPMFVPSLS